MDCCHRLENSRRLRAYGHWSDRFARAPNTEPNPKRPRSRASLRGRFDVIAQPQVTEPQARLTRRMKHEASIHDARRGQQARRINLATEASFTQFVSTVGSDVLMTSVPVCSALACARLC